MADSIYYYCNKLYIAIVTETPLTTSMLCLHLTMIAYLISVELAVRPENRCSIIRNSESMSGQEQLIFSPFKTPVFIGYLHLVRESAILTSASKQCPDQL